MKRFIYLLVLLSFVLSSHGQISDLQVRLGGDMWKLSYTASSSQINCGLCPQLVQASPGTETLIAGLQDSVIQHQYMRAGVNIAVSASIGWPALRAEIQISPSMRQLTPEGEQGSRYTNRNISALVGVNPMQFDSFAGRYYIGAAQYFLDFSDLGVYAQWSYDGGFEEYIRSTNNLALLARWQPTLWLSDQQKLGVSLRTGARVWLLGNGQADGPFVGSSGIPKKVRPHADWFVGLCLKVSPF